MLHTEFQASEPSGSEKEDFLIFFLYIYIFEARTPRCRTILDPTLDKGPLGNATYQISII